jgi:PIN domain nuclease of toxin-antitoxin system
MRVLLDTVAFLFAIENPDRLSRRARAVLREPANQRELSVVSLAEVAMKNDAGKLNLSREDALEALRRLQVTLVAFAEAHVLQLMTLPVHHRDPFDRMLIAQALAEDVRVMTCDKEFRKYKGLEVIW